MNKSYERYLDKKVFYTEREFIDMYGQNYRMFLNHDLLIKDEEVFNRYKNDKPTLNSTIQGNNTTVSKTLLHDLLNNEGMYQYLFQNMDNDFGNVVRISLFKEGNKIDSIIISRAVLSSLLLGLAKDELSEKEQMRIALISNVSTINALRTKYRSDSHFCIIDTDAVSIPSITLFNILMMSNARYDSFITSQEFELTIDGKKTKYSTRVLAYMIVSFMERERILAKYLLPEIVYNRYNDLKSLKIVDFESINKNIKSNDYDSDGISQAQKVELSDEIKNLLGDGIPKNLSNLEIAIVKYIKLLSVLEFNQELYASNSTNNPLTEPEQIKYITLENNVILPNDLVMLMSYIFKELGIKYTIENKVLSFKYGEYVLELDVSNEAIIHDLSAAKMNEGITAIRCVNINEVTRKKFDELLSKINYSYLVQEENKKNYMVALEKYRQIHVRPVTTKKERIFLYFKILSSNTLRGTDSIYYGLKLFKNFFREDDGISINIISSSANTINDYEYVPVMIMSVENNGEYLHFIIDANSKEVINSLSTEELIGKFDDKTYAYLDVDENNIPGIVRGSAYVR